MAHQTGRVSLWITILYSAFRPSDLQRKLQDFETDAVAYAASGPSYLRACVVVDSTWQRTEVEEAFQAGSDASLPWCTTMPVDVQPNIANEICVE